MVMDEMTKEYCVSCGDETPYDWFDDITGVGYSLLLFDPFFFGR